MRRLGTLALLGAGVLASAGLTGCDQVADTLSGPEPRPAAEAYAAALAAGTPGSVPLAEPAAAAADEAHAGLVAGLEPAFGGVEPRVEVLDVSRSGDVAEVDLGWTWALPAGEWSYGSTTSLRLVDDEWRAVWQPGVVEPSLVEGEVLDASTLGASRGDVVGAGGEPIVTERPVVRLGVDRGAVSPKQAVRAAERLAGLADLDVAAYRDRVEAAGEQAFVEAIVYRAAEVPGPVAQAAGSTAGVVAIADEQPLAPTRDFAAELLGSVGEVTAEMMADQPGVYRMGDRAGLSGLQARYDEELRGSPGMLVRAVDDAPGPAGASASWWRCRPPTATTWCSASTSTCSAPPSSCWPGSAPPAPWSPCGPAPVRCWLPPTGPGSGRRMSRRSARRRRAAPSRSSPAWRCCAPG